MLYLVLSHLLYHAVEECQATALATERTVAYSGKVGVLVKPFSLEYSHHALVLHLSVCHDGIKDNLSVHINVLLLVPSDFLQEFGNGEERTAGEPTAYIVMAQVILQRIEGQGHDVVLQFLQVVYACNLLHRCRVAENEVAETEIAAQQITDFHIQHL